MTKEEYEKQQSVVRRVFDPDTGRHRSVGPQLGNENLVTVTAVRVCHNYVSYLILEG